MAAQPDQLIMYDSVVRDWVINEFSQCIETDPGSGTYKDFYILVGTPDRAFGEYCTLDGRPCPDGGIPLPRAALTVGDIYIDDERFNPAVIRKLGYSDSDKLDLRRAYYPVPFNIPYTLNFWTEYQREMNQLMMVLLNLFKAQVHYVQVDTDVASPTAGLYGVKDIGLYKEGNIVDSGDNSPGSDQKTIRRTFNMEMKAWLWDFNFTTKKVVKEFAMEWYGDRDLTTLLSTASTPQRETLFSGDGIAVTFSGTPSRLPIVENTFLLDATIGSSVVRVRDDGAGNLVDPIDSSVASGTVNYTTGQVDITFNTAPDDTTDIAVAYYSTVD